jgi:hypothetical protein
VVDAEARTGSECQAIGIIWAVMECGRDYSPTRRRVDPAIPAEAALPLATTPEYRCGKIRAAVMLALRIDYA